MKQDEPFGHAAPLRLSRSATLLALALALATTVAVRVATADDPLPVRFEYEARPGCPDANSFVREVLARAPRARVAAPLVRARTLMVRVRPSAHGLEGVLSVRDADGTSSSERSVRAQNCAELVTALAVISAVVIDPATARRTSVEGGPVAGPEVVDAATATTGASDAAALPATSDAAPPATTATAAPSDGPTADDVGPPSANREERSWTVSGGAGGGIIGGASPTVLLGVSAFAEVGRVTSGLLEPSARLRFQRTATGGPDRAGAAASFVLTTGAADLCPIAFRRPSVRIQPCARVEAGALYASGRDVVPIRSDVRPWVGMGPLARLRLDIAGPFFAEVEAAILVLAVRDRFVVEADTLVYRPPAIAGSAAFAAGLAFW